MTNILKTSLLLCVLAVGLSLTAATRVAIVSKSQGKFADLLTAEFSKIPDVELLERKEIRKVLKEHKISSVVHTPRNIFLMGQLLKTDVFVVPQKNAKGELTGLVIYDARNGLRYWDSAFPDEELETAANFAVDALKQAISKRQEAKSGKLKYVSLLTVRNVDLPRDQDNFCKSIGVLFQRQIGNAKNFVVLERDYLDWLNQERNLPGMDWSGKLLGANTVLKIEISRKATANPEDHQITCSLIIPGSPKLSVTGSEEKPEIVANKLAKKFTALSGDTLEISPPDVNKEARKFHHEYLILTGHKKFVDALSKIEAADALWNKPVNIHLVKATSLAATDTLDPGNVSNYRGYSPPPETIIKSLQIAEKALDKRIQVHHKNPGKHESFRDGLNDFNSKLFDTKINRYPKDVQKKIRDFNTRFIKFRHEDRKSSYFPNGLKVNSPQTFFRYNDYVFECQFISLYETNELWFESSYPIFLEWLEITDQYLKNLKPRESTKPSDNNFHLKERLMNVFLSGINGRKSGLSGQNKANLKKLYTRMLEHTSASVRVAAFAGKLAMEGDKKPRGDAYWVQAYKKLAEFAKKEISALGEGYSSIIEKEHCYLLLSYIFYKTDWKNQIDDIVDFRVGILKFMISRNELHHYFFIFAIDNLKSQGDYQTAINLIEKMENMVNAKGTYIIAYPKKRKRAIEYIKKHLAEKKRSILTIRPDLIPQESSDLPWKKVITVFNGKGVEDGLCRIGAVVPVSGKVYAMGYGIDSNQKYFQLLDISYPNIKINKLGKGNFYWQRQFWSIDDRPVIHACIGEGNYIAASHRHGILIFPLNGGKPTQINLESGLPSNVVQSVAYMDGKIYAGLGRVRQEGYFVSYDLKNKKLELLASSQRSGTASPLDNLEKPFYIGGMVPDPEKNRILMFVNFKTGFNKRNVTGIWEFNTKTQKWKNLLPLPFAFFENIRKKGNKILLSSTNWCAEFNPKTDKANLVYSTDHRIRKSIPGQSPLIGIKADYRPPFILTDKNLWSGNLSINCIPLKTGKQLDLINPNNKQYFQAINIFEPLDNNKYILAGDMYTLLLLELKE